MLLLDLESGISSIVSFVITFPVSIAIGIWAQKAALQKTHGGCRVILVEQSPDASATQP